MRSSEDPTSTEAADPATSPPAAPLDARRAERAAGRRSLIVGGLVLGGVAILAVLGVGGTIGSALEVIAERSGAGTDPEVHSLISRARTWGTVAALAVVGLAIGMFAWMVARHEREVAALRSRLEAQATRDEARRDEHRTAVIEGLVHLAAARDGDTGAHLERVQHYVRALAEQMQGTVDEVDAAFIETLVQTAPLHDIGKVGVPDEILLKPGPLTDEQRERMQKHVLHGLDTLMEVRRRSGDDEFLRVACEVAFAHHERFDGTGYPFGLAGETIPLAARIVAVADVYDALRNERVYKDALDHDAARTIIVEQSGTHFDPVVVAAFEAVEDRFRVIAGDPAADADTDTGDRPAVTIETLPRDPLATEPPARS